MNDVFLEAISQHLDYITDEFQDWRRKIFKHCHEVQGGGGGGGGGVQQWKQGERGGRGGNRVWDLQTRTRKLYRLSALPLSPARQNEKAKYGVI